jgi:hypothetical protein
MRTWALLTLAAGVAVLAIAGGIALQSGRSGHGQSPPVLSIDCGPSHGGTISCVRAHGCTVATPSEGCEDTVVDTRPVAGTYRYELAPSSSVTGAHPYTTRQQITLALAQAPARAQLASGVTAGELRRLVPQLPASFLDALDHLYRLPALPIGNAAGGVRELPGGIGVVLGCRSPGTAITCQALAPGDEAIAGDTLYRLDWAQSPAVSPPPPGTAREAYDEQVEHALGGPPSAAEAAVLAWLLPRPPST